MKWGLIILVVLGVVAAACAALLVGALGTNSSTQAQVASGIEVAIAKKSLPQMTLITADHFIKQTVSKNDLPQGQQLVSPTQVVGQILGVPVVEGQVLTASCFVPERTAQRLIGGLPDGFRLYTISVPSRGLPDRFLLNPGCVVDILASFRLSGSEAEALSKHMLQAMEVVAVSGESVVSDPQEAKDARQRSGSQVLVTLLVTSKQAEGLQLVVDNASSVTLLIRNPMDKTEVSTEGSVLKKGELASPASSLSPADLKPGQGAVGLIPSAPEVTQPDNASRDLPAAAQPTFEAQPQRRSNPRWGIDVIRGPARKTEEVPNQPSDLSGQDEAK